MSHPSLTSLEDTTSQLHHMAVHMSASTLKQKFVLAPLNDDD
jgi:hypothetical protein